MRAAPGPLFNRLWGAALASNFADGLIAASVALVAISLTTDPLAVSLLNAAATLPWLVFAIISGTVVDRCDRRLLMAVANLIRAGVVGGMAILVATGRVSIPALVAAVVVLGTLETLYDSSAQALVPAVTDGAVLDSANGRFQAGETVMQNFIAVPVSTVIFVAAAAAPFGLSAAAFAGSAVMAMTLPRAVGFARRTATMPVVENPAPLSPAVAEPALVAGHGGPADAARGAGPAADARLAADLADDRVAGGFGPAGGPVRAQLETGRSGAFHSFLADLRAGVGYLWGHRDLRRLWAVATSLSCALAFAQGAIMVFIVVGLEFPMASVGAVSAAVAVGAVAGSVAAPSLTAAAGRRAAMAGAAVLCGIALLGLGLSPATAWGRIVACVMWSLMAFAGSTWNVASLTLRQRLVPEALMGRVNGAWRTVGWGMTPVATLAGGLAARADLRLPIVLGAVATMIIGAVGWVALRFVASVGGAHNET